MGNIFRVLLRLCYIFQKQPFANVFKIGVLKNFAIFTEKHLCKSLF